MELRADGLVLRRPRAGDADALVAALEDREISRWAPRIPWRYTRAHADDFLDRVCRDWLTTSERVFAITEAETAAFLGLVTVRLRDGGSVGYRLAREARGRGVMTRAVGRVVYWARQEHGITRLVLTTHPDNVPSQRVAERCGFRPAGRIRHDPPFPDGRTESILFERSWPGGA
jgi:RimJ/RimL family protein N-acetyltransferase